MGLAGGRKKHLSLRVEEPTVDELDRLAQRSGLSRSELAERYLSEGVRREEFPQIYFREGALGRRAALLGTRLDVWQIVETVRSHGNSLEQAADYLELPVERVRAAVRYAAAHREEVEGAAEREIAASERAEELWRAEQAFLAS
jgi:uncharacterized protein (DUF433 family)